jgi:hypothetical protein
MKGHDMRRFLSLTVLTAAAAVLLATGRPALAAPAPATPAPAAAGCLSGAQVAIRSLSFDPGSVARGQTATATVVARNCTRQPLSATLQWTAQFLGTGAAVPAGCPIVDPLVVPASFAARGRFSSSIGYLVFPACTATALRVTARFSAGGVVLASRTADVPVLAAS